MDPTYPDAKTLGPTHVITIELPVESAPLLSVVRTILADDVPDAALIGGLAVTARVASTTAGYRATADVDFVTADDISQTMTAFVEDLDNEA
ncbi:MAG: hypothetical protein ABIP03_12695 [Aquihabitans sp.]